MGAFAGVWAVPQTEYAKGAQADGAGPDICMFSRSVVLSESSVAQASNKRMQQLVRAVQSQLAKDREQLSASIQAFNERAATLGDGERLNQQRALKQRQQALQQNAQRLDARLRHTSDRVTQHINDLIDPLVEDVYQKRGCDILLKRDAVLGGNRGNDLTAEVITVLNNEVANLKFDLLALPGQTSAAGDKGSS